MGEQKVLPVDTFVIHNAMPAGTVQNCANKNIRREHKILCVAIREMETLNQSSAKGEEELKMSFPAHLTPRQHSKLTKLVGRRCIVSCLLQGKKVDALWDTGAEVYIISKSWMDAYLPDVPVRDMREELLRERELDLRLQMVLHSCMIAGLR